MLKRVETESRMGSMVCGVTEAMVWSCVDVCVTRLLPVAELVGWHRCITKVYIALLCK